MLCLEKCLGLVSVSGLNISFTSLAGETIENTRVKLVRGGLTDSPPLEKCSAGARADDCLSSAVGSVARLALKSPQCNIKHYHWATDRWTPARLLRRI